MSKKQQADEKLFAQFIHVDFVGEFRTYAFLQGVRRIQSSTGRAGKSRSPSCITGLRFDYHNECHFPTIIGQWMDEHDSFHLSQGEAIDCFTVWLTKQGLNPDVQGLYNGVVVAIRIDTSYGRSKIFESWEEHMPLIECTQHEYRTTFHEKIVSNPLPIYSICTYSR